MSNFNDVFDVFPDYDVFDENNSDIRPMPKHRREKFNDFDYIQYDRNTDFRENEPEEEFEEPEHSTDYRDDYGVYRVYEERIKNSASIIFFPFTFIWLEVLLRLGCGQSLLTFSMLFVVLFSLSLSGIFTILSTFFGEKINRTMVKIIVALITVFYCAQMVCFNMTQTFLSVTNLSFSGSIAEFNRVMDTMSDKVFYLLGCFFPFVLFLFVGKYLFPFRRIRIPGKICLLLAAVLLHFSALTVISFDKKSENPKSNYAVYHQKTDNVTVQERFGLYTMVAKEVYENK